jgi:hypothetical protein
MNGAFLACLSGLRACNWHFCFFAALACVSIIRAIVTRKGPNRDQAHEHWVAGIVHFVVSLFWL